MKKQSQLTGSHEAWQRPSTPVCPPHKQLIDEATGNTGEYPTHVVETREMLNVFFKEIAENNEKLSDREIYLMAKCVLERGENHATDVIINLNGKLIQRIIAVLAISDSAKEKYGSDFPKFHAINEFMWRFYSAFMSKDFEACKKMAEKLEPIVNRLEESIIDLG